MGVFGSSHARADCKFVLVKNDGREGMDGSV